MADKKEEQEEKIELFEPETQEKISRFTGKVKDYWQEFTKGVFSLNPFYVLAMGLCPLLAVTYSIDSAIAISFAFSFALIISEMIFSIMKKFATKEIRFPMILLVVSSLVALASMLIRFYSPSLEASLGIYLAIIAINCIIFSRINGFAVRNNFFRSILDAAGFSIGYSLALIAVALTRELLGTGKIVLFDRILFQSAFYHPMQIFLSAPGAFFTIGFAIAIINLVILYSKSQGRKKLEKIALKNQKADSQKKGDSK